MSGSSNYPGALDTDSNLIRRVASDVLAIEDHNNLVDAIESMQAGLGAFDQATVDPSSVGAINALHAAIGGGSSSGYDPRHLFTSGAKKVWYASSGSVAAPVSALGSGSVAFDTHRGLATCTDNSSSSQTGLLLDLSSFASGDIWGAARVNYEGVGGSSLWAQVGDSGMVHRTMVNFDSSAGVKLYTNGSAGGAQAGIWTSLLASPWLWVGFEYDGTNTDWYFSSDGVVWRWGLASAPGARPVGFEIACGPGSTGGDAVVIDFMGADSSSW